MTLKMSGNNCSPIIIKFVVLSFFLYAYECKALMNNKGIQVKNQLYQRYSEYLDHPGNNLMVSIFTS